MIRTIYQFGQHLREVEDMKPYFEIATAPYREKGTEEVVIVAEIRDRRFQKLTIETYKRTLVPKYLYRELAGKNGTGLVPTLYVFRDEDKINPKTNESKLTESCKKFLNRLGRCLKANKEVYDRYFDLDDFQKKLIGQIEIFIREKLSDNKNYLFTLQIDGSWLGDIPAIKEIFEKEAYSKYYKDGSGNLYMSKDKVCSVSYENTPEVWGWVSTLGFTVEKPSFSRNGFDAKDSYKMFPVSPEAVKVLEGTKRALDEQLSCNFSGIKFFVLPHFVTLDNDIIKKGNIVRKFVKAAKAPNEGGFDTLIKSIVSSERVFSNIIDDPELGHNSVYYDIFFYEEVQAQISIKLHVSDVLPSRFKKIFENKNHIESFYRPITQWKDTKKGTGDYLRLNFERIKTYFSIEREKKPPLLEPYFFKIAEAIFYNNKLDKEQIISAFMRKIVLSFKSMGNPKEKDKSAMDRHVKHSFCIYQFFQHLQLFGNMEPPIAGVIVLSSLDFVNQHEAFFKNRLQKAAFLLGCAVEVLLGAQRSNLNGNEPFAKRLNNLSVDYRELQRIKTELLSKVKQYADAKKLYDGDYIHQMLVEFDRLMLGGDDPNLSKTQVSYAFSVGLVMEKEFTKHRIAGYIAQKEAKKQAQEEQSQQA